MTILLLVVSILVIFLWGPHTEYMTNADVAKKEEWAKGKPQTWEVADKMKSKSTHKKAVDVGEPIMGPQTTKLDPNEPMPSSSGSGANGAGEVYPDIYGPDKKPTPGTGGSNHKQSSDDPPDYESYLPANEFPAGPSTPMPYLNDFSKILGGH